MLKLKVTTNIVTLDNFSASEKIGRQYNSKENEKLKWKATQGKAISVSSSLLSSHRPSSQEGIRIRFVRFQDTIWTLFINRQGSPQTRTSCI